MSKFCGTCGSKLDERTGLCPNCSKVNAAPVSAAPTQAANKKAGEPKTKKKPGSKKAIKNTVIGILLAVVIATPTICAMVYVDMLNIPFINSAFVAIGLKGGTSKEKPALQPEATPEDKPVVEQPDQTQQPDLNTEYEVPEFDSEAYFRENTTLLGRVNAQDSEMTRSESEAYAEFGERGFSVNPIAYEYDMNGTYLGEGFASSYSSSRHPIYQTDVLDSWGRPWSVTQVNGAFYANPLFYNGADDMERMVLVSETEYMTSYTSTDNAFYVNIPNDTQVEILVVERIDIATLDGLFVEGGASW